MAGDEYTVKASANETNGSLGFIVGTVPPGNGPVAHSHTRHDEAFFMLDGELEFLDGDKTFVASAGDFVFVPRGVRHRFKNISSRDAKSAFLYTPGGIERSMIEHGHDPEPGQRPKLWTADDFSPGLVAMMEELGTLVLPEQNPWRCQLDDSGPGSGQVESRWGP
ncbi:cupin domain-containing protein [Streptomyces sp. NPDC059909]|uniref:cupin domain-containing protein n=1 Tax=Streptomyces sp. NPDC059909 TaxID=3346998 RepID=UPI003667874A